MTQHFRDVAFTPAVIDRQQHYGSARIGARAEAAGGSPDTLGRMEAEFLADADSFYLATVSETGWPYLQHRGGPRGFVKVLSESQIAFSDFRGNRQYITAGNAMNDGKVSLFVMDYANRRRLKMLGTLRFIDVADADPELIRKVALPGYNARIERVALIDVVAFDWNCPQHITPRFTLEEIEAISTRAVPVS